MHGANSFPSRVRLALALAIVATLVPAILCAAELRRALGRHPLAQRQHGPEFLRRAELYSKSHLRPSPRTRELLRLFLEPASFFKRYPAAREPRKEDWWLWRSLNGSGGGLVCTIHDDQETRCKLDVAHESSLEPDYARKLDFPVSIQLLDPTLASGWGPIEEERHFVLPLPQGRTLDFAKRRSGSGQGCWEWGYQVRDPAGELIGEGQMILDRSVHRTVLVSERGDLDVFGLPETKVRHMMIGCDAFGCAPPPRHGQPGGG